MHYNMLIKQAREERGWSQKDVAEKIGTDSKTVSRWERRIAYPSPHFRQKLGDLFEKSLRELDLLTSSESEREYADPPPSMPAIELREDTQKPETSDSHSNNSVQQTGPSPATGALSGQRVRTAALQLQNRTRMLSRLRHAYSELLEYSLQKVVWIELGLAEMPNAVQNAMNRLVRLSQQEAQMLPAGTSILEVYESSGRELLILGAPGAGKSTLLFQLAQMLVQQAEQDETHPLPVVLRLSSWAEKKPSLEDWMSEQLALTYDVSQKLSTQWVRNEQILPLLDGLDEMDAASRSACIAAINDYHREHLLVSLVICSRRTEYEDAASQQKLKLQHAVLIQPLTPEQVNASLDQIGQPLTALRQTLQTNLALQELITTPLELSILILTYLKNPMPSLSHELPTLQKQIWTDYVAHMISQKGDVKRYSFQQTCSWLNWLACNLQKHYQTVFYLERLQSDWLPESLQQRTAWLTMHLPMILLGLLVSCLIGLFSQTVIDLTTGIQAAVIGCLLANCFSQMDSTGSTGNIPTSEQARPRVRNLYEVLISGGTGLVIAGSFGFELGPDYGPGDWVRDGLIYGSIIGVTCYLLLSMFPLLSSSHATPDAPRVITYLRRMLSTLHLRRSLLGAVALGLGYGLSTGLSYGTIYGPSTGLNFLLTYAGFIFPISMIVEKNKGEVGLTERLRWSGGRFFHSLRSLEHCLASAALAIGLLLTVGLSYGLTTGLGLPLSNNLGFRLSYGLSDGLTDGPDSGLTAGLNNGLIMGFTVAVGIGLAYWLIVGLFQSIAQEQIEDQDRQSLNQGVRRSAVNSTIIGILSAGTIGGLGFFGYGLSYWLNEGLSKGLNEGLDKGLIYALSSVWLFAMIGGLLGWAISGGWAVLRHFVLRWLLHRRRIFPWHAQNFLNNATDGILLQHVGGGYSFIHRLLLEHFANLDAANEADLEHETHRPLTIESHFI